MYTIYVCRGGVLLVVLSIIATGCKGTSSGNISAWIESGNKKKVWEKTNSSTTKYLCVYEQFGSTAKTETTEVKLTIGNVIDSKARLIFGLKKNPNDTISHFVVSIRTQVSDKGVSAYYISCYDDVTADFISQIFNEEAILKGA